MIQRSSARHVAIVGTSLDILGGQGVQACRLIEGLEAEGIRVTFIPINPRFPRVLGWVRRHRERPDERAYYFARGPADLAKR